HSGLMHQQSDHSVVIKYGVSDQVILKNVTLGDLDASDFVFVSPVAPTPNVSLPPGQTYDGTAAWGGTITGTADADTVSFASANVPIYVDLAREGGWVQAQDAGQAVEHLVSIENVTGAPNLMNWLHGDQNNNILIGGNSADWLEGGGGDNTLDGRGAQNDTADYLNTDAPLTIDLTLGKAIHFTGVDTLLNIEQFRATNWDDKLIGDGGDNVFWAMNGNDTVRSGGGNDVIEGGADNDVIDGGAGAD